MKTRNKKSIGRYLSVILIFSILFLFSFFMVIFLKDIGKTEILDPISNISQSTQFTISEEMQDFIQLQPEEFENLNFHYDLYFVFSFIGFFLFALFGSYKAKQENYMSFFGFLFFGIVLFLYISTIITIFADWLVLNLINGFLEFDLNTVPIINYYITNMGLINFILATILIMVNRLNFSLTREDLGEINQFQGGGFER